MEKTVLHATEIETKQDYYSVLSQLFSATSQDHLLLRTMIYEFARFRLRKDLYQNFRNIGWSGMHERLRALEAAIDEFEADCTRDVVPRNFLSEPETDRLEEERTTHAALVPRAETPKEVIASYYEAPIPASFFARSSLAVRQRLPVNLVSGHDSRAAIARAVRYFGTSLWSTFQMVAAAMLGVALYAALEGHGVIPRFNKAPPFDEVAPGPVPPNVAAVNMRRQEPNNSVTGKNSLIRTETASQPGTSSIPLPSAYGVYALSDGHLTDLDPLPIRVPDSRVAISSPISTPSRVHLPIGQLQFVVFRRDLVDSAPDRVVVRVVAQVTRALMFDSNGKATITNVEGSWVVRSNSYQMRVAPVPDNPEMIVIRPEHAQFVFPAGRYALVLKNVAYDFTLDGPLTDAAHCLERADALNAPVYTECRNL